MTKPSGQPSPSRSRPSTKREGATILVVEDEPAPLEMLDASLTARHYQVRGASTGRQALDLIDEDEPDVVIVDLGLPDIDGIDLCRHIRARVDSSIIVVTADGAEERMVQALDEGADDYITKPFSMPELLARVGVAVRRHAAIGSVLRDEPIEIGSITIDPQGFLVVVSGRQLALPRRQFVLLVALARNAGRIVTYRTLVAQLWGHDQPASGSNALRVLVSGLRHNLGSGPGIPCIVSETHIGYRLVEPTDSE